MLNIWVCLRLLIARCLFILGGILVILPFASHASERNARKRCAVEILRAEKKYKIPVGILEAIATIESGRSHKLPEEDESVHVAWPWVLNVAGKPYYFNDQTLASQALKKALDRGETNIDVGCMQLNYKHHGKNFLGPIYILDPARNVDYAARFLCDLKARYGSWTKAVGYYHSATLRHQVPYRNKVYKKWRAVVAEQKQKGLDKRLGRGQEGAGQNKEKEQEGTNLFHSSSGRKDNRASGQEYPLRRQNDRIKNEIIRPQRHVDIQEMHTLTADSSSRSANHFVNDPRNLPERDSQGHNSSERDIKVRDASEIPGVSATFSSDMILGMIGEENGKGRLESSQKVK